MPADQVNKNLKTPLLVNTLLLSTIIPLPASALDCIWTGGIGNWGDPNWTDCAGGSPAAADNATINIGSVTAINNQNVQSYSQTNGTLTGPGDLTASGQTTLSGGAMSGDGTTRAEGGLTFNGTFFDVQGNRTLVNAGGQTADWSSGNIRLLNTGSTLINGTTAQLNITGATRIQYGSGSFINDGTINVNTNDALQTISVVNLTNNGTIDVQQGTLHATDLNFSNDGTIRIADGARMSGTRALSNSAIGLFTGDGTIDPGTNFTFTNAGQINPGDGIGELTVDGDMVMLTTSIFNVELGGLDNFDLLTVTGESTLNGTLNVFLTNSFTPTAGQTFDILLTDILLGEFSSVVGMNNPGFEWFVSYIINEEGQDIARLGVSAVPLPAAGWLLLSGLGVLVTLGRRKRA
ncbi:MAG: VPLPA-CTERM sorting domain-containing protein [Candidatus Thiodiazotropha taylori]|nr:VPLPA-CTERM sorting domain-containing protein [Candidatus Thiodiazotropha taylori]